MNGPQASRVTRKNNYDTFVRVPQKQLRYSERWFGAHPKVIPPSKVDGVLVFACFRKKYTSKRGMTNKGNENNSYLKISPPERFGSDLGAIWEIWEAMAHSSFSHNLL